jgi:hypothetical protein
LVAIAADGSSEIIGTATSDVSGTFAIQWKPTTEGLYTIVANFDGTDSYYDSWAETYVAVGPASAQAPSASEVADAVASSIPTPATPVSASDVANQVISELPTQDNTLLLAIAAVVVIALVIGVLNLALLMKKKQA